MVTKKQYWKSKKNGTCCHDSRPVVRKFSKSKKKIVKTTKCRECHNKHIKYNENFRKNNPKYMQKWVKKHPTYMRKYWRKINK